MRGDKFFRFIIENNFPKDYQILCYNCNWIKWLNSLTTIPRQYNLKLKQVVIDKYGGECICCGNNKLKVLTIDHVNGGGREQRRNGLGRETLYIFLRDNPISADYQVLCRNCNSGRYLNGGICPHNVTRKCNWMGIR